MTILIIEDEPRTAALLREFIKLYENAADILPAIESITGAVNYLKNCVHQPDLIFLDVELSDGNSFEIFGKVEVISPVVFCTAYEDFTLQAFKTNGIDYVLKPFTEDDIKRALKKVTSLKTNWGKNEISGYKQEKLPLLPPKKIIHLLVNYRDKMYPIHINNIAVFYIENKQVYLATLKNERYPLQRKIDDIESLLDVSVFFRINRQMIINREAVESIETYFNRKLFIKLNILTNLKPIVSRLKVSQFITWIENC